MEADRRMSCGWVFGGAVTGQGEVEGTEVGVDVDGVLGRETTITS